MPSVNVFFQQNPNNDTLSAQYSNGGCFGFMAQGYNFFTGAKARTKWLSYRLENSEQEVNCQRLFDGNNPLFPYHRYMSSADYREWLTAQGIVSSQKLNELQLQDFGYIMIEMQPEGFENVGIPQDMFISGLFTARNVSHVSHTEERYAFLDAAIHPMVGYALFKAVTVYSDTSNRYCRYGTRLQRESSSNLDMWTFDKANMLNLINCVNGREHTPYFGTVGGIIQNDGYKRDRHYEGTADETTSHVLREPRVTANMNTTMSPVPVTDASEVLFFPTQYTYNYMATVLKELAGEPVLKAAEDVPALAPFVNNDVYKTMFVETRPRFKKKYKVGDLVGPRKDSIGSNQYARELFSAGNFNSGVNKPMITNGLVPLITEVEAVDDTRIESVKLRGGTWVHPRMIALVSSKNSERLTPPEDFMENPVAGMLLTLKDSPQDRLHYLRSFDPFSGRGLTVIYPTVNNGRGSTEQRSVGAVDVEVADFGKLKAKRKVKAEKKVVVTDAMKRAAKAVAAGKKAVAAKRRSTTAVRS